MNEIIRKFPSTTEEHINRIEEIVKTMLSNNSNIVGAKEHVLELLTNLKKRYTEESDRVIIKFNNDEDIQTYLKSLNDDDNKLLTATDFVNLSILLRSDIFPGSIPTFNLGHITVLMKLFAWHHVQKALESVANKNLQFKSKLLQQVIINESYPLTNIKE